VDASEQPHIASKPPYRSPVAGKPKDVGEIIAATIKRVRKARGYTQESLGERSGLSQTMISAIERRTTSPAADTLQAIAKALGVEAWQLQIDGMDDNLLFTETLPNFVYHYRDMSPADRQALEILAARLARPKSP
jgi:transcriptional regulator with XRE-family HTH domain